MVDKESLRALDFAHIRELVVGFCATDLGKEQAEKLLPVLSRSEVNAEYDFLEEVMTFDGEPSLSTVVDIRPLLNQTRAGAVLTTDELLKVRRCCVALRSCREFFQRQGEKVRRLQRIMEGLVVLPELELAIERAIDESGAVRDNASPKLQELRREIREQRNFLVAQLERMVEDSPAIFEGTVMVRRERFVLPVKVTERNKVPGVVHAASASGETLFIEPLETILEQNRLQELRDAEAEEVNRIRRELSEMVARYQANLSEALERLATLDLLFAKRRFVLKFDCHRPAITDESTIELVGARHPLLMLRKSVVVPLNLRFPDGVSVVLISGPNAGGKTVVLKTIGLCALLMKCGIFVPAANGTKLSWVERVFADIGDEQSLEAGMSSFTAHLMRLKEMLDCADRHSLVLIDEIGASTAPEEGAGLAMAILEELRNRQVWTVATTHFNNLKIFVQNEPGMANAAMEFRDAPTYRLKMGVAGESGAFEIAKRLGLPASVLERAKLRLGKEWVDLGERLRALEEELEVTRRTKQEVEVERNRLAELMQQYKKRLTDFQEWMKTEKERFRQEQERLLKDTRRQVENFVRELRERRADHESIVRVKRFVEERLQTLAEEIPVVSDGAISEFHVGDFVESKMFSRHGKVMEVKGSQVVVAFGNIRMELPASALRLARQQDTKPEPAADDYEFVPRLNVRGMTRDEAEMALKQFLAEAEVVGVKELSILHGKGSGVLRQFLWQRLRQDRRVLDIKFAEPADGGMGVTVVKLRRSGDQA